MTPAKKTVAVVMGGVSSEHEVSLASGSMLLKHLDAKTYLGYPILISRTNRWYWPKQVGGQTLLWENPWDLESGPPDPENWHSAGFPHFGAFPKASIFLIGLHGKGGEDGTLQGFLDLCGQAYTGSGCLGSALCMDKIYSKDLYRMHGIPTADSLVARSSGAELPKPPWGYPSVLKDPTGGSSIGVLPVHNQSEYEEGLQKMLGESSRVLIEPYLKGREATCGYLENAEPLPPTEILPDKDPFFNYEAKYQSERTREITPGNFSPELTRTLQDLAKRCHRILGLSVYSRTDFILVDDRPFVLETNSLPGMTQASLIPQAAACIGLSFTQLISKIIEESLKQ